MAVAMERVARAAQRRFDMVLRCCTSIHECERVHKEMLESGCVIDTSLGNLLLKAYSRSGSLCKTKQVFDGMEQRDFDSWDTMLEAYAQNGHFQEALGLFRKMEKPDSGSFRKVFWICSRHRELHEGRQLHLEFLARGFAYDISCGNALISMYTRCDEPLYAREVFDGMSQRDSISWNSMITILANDGHVEEAVQLQRRADLEGMVTDGISFCCICGQCKTLRTARTIHLRASLGGLVDSNSVLQTAIVNMYARCGSLTEAREVFDRMQGKDVPAWNAIILICAKLGLAKEALELFRRMNLEGFRPNAISYVGALTATASLGDATSGKRIHLAAMECERENRILNNAVINMYVKSAENMDSAEEVFLGMQCKETSTWNVMLAGYTQQGQSQKALLLLRQMDLEGAKLDRISYLNLVTACAGAGSLAHSKTIHTRLISSFSRVDLVLENAVINMFAKSGSIQHARNAFEGMSHWDEGSWNVIITAYAQHGLAREALELLHGMQLYGESLNSVTLTVVLLACSHAGLEKEAWFHFEETGAHCRTMEHYHCMVDMLGRVGKLNEAEEFMHEFSSEDSGTAWKGLLSACKIHGNTTLGAIAFEKVASEYDESAPFILFQALTRGEYVADDPI